MLKNTLGVKIGGILLSSMFFAGCSDLTKSDSDDKNENQFQAVITYTDNGVPHVKADSYLALGFGVGYEQATENLCTLSEQILKLKGRKSEFFGPGDAQENLASDIGYAALDYSTQAQALIEGLSVDARDLLAGYVKGFNKNLQERSSPEHYPSPCRGARWVEPITETDLMAYHLDLAGLASARNFTMAHAAAQPPSIPIAAGAKSLMQHRGLQIELDADLVLTNEGIGSNGWAIGHEKMADVDIGLLANPHFPWEGEMRFYQQHLTIPGELNVAGAAMIGLPLVVIGFNENLGWTHTVSQAKHFTLYQLELHPSDPMKYKYDDGYKDITAKEVVIKVNTPMGEIDHKHTVYYSHYGPMVNLSSLHPALGWSTTQAFTYRDANARNNRMFDHWLAMNRAENAQAFKRAFSENQGIPWVNTLVIDAKSKQAGFIDGTQVPQLSTAAEAFFSNAINTNPLVNSLWRNGSGSIVLPGHLSTMEWDESGEAGSPGLVPFSQAPQLWRNDYVFNANSSHWMTNPEQPLEGYSIAYGPEFTARSPRTRYNYELLINDSLGVVDSQGKLTFETLKSALTENGSLFGHGDMKHAIGVRCAQQPVDEEGNDVVLTICPHILNWDGKYNIDSVGAVAMREFLYEFKNDDHEQLDSSLFLTPFDKAQPLTTPSGIAQKASDNVMSDPVFKALYTAQNRLTALGIDLSKPLKDHQYVIKAEGQAPVPVSGGYTYEGVFNMAETRFKSRSTSDLSNVVKGVPNDSTYLSTLTEDGQSSTAYHVNYGSSFMMALAWKDGKLTAQTMMAFGQSHDPESEFFDDQTKQYSQLIWKDYPFSIQDIETNRTRVVTVSQ